MKKDEIGVCAGFLGQQKPSSVSSKDAFSRHEPSCDIQIQGQRPVPGLCGPMPGNLLTGLLDHLKGLA